MKYLTVGDMIRQLQEYPKDQLVLVGVEPLIGAKIVSMGATEFVDVQMNMKTDAVIFELEKMALN